MAELTAVLCVLILVVCAVIYCCLPRRRKDQQNQETYPEQPNSNPVEEQYQVHTPYPVAYPLDTSPVPVQIPPEPITHAPPCPSQKRRAMPHLSEPILLEELPPYKP